MQYCSLQHQTLLPSPVTLTTGCCFCFGSITSFFGLKLNIQKSNIMTYGPICSWPIDGETMEPETGLIFLGSKITSDDDCSHEIKRHLLLGRKVLTNLDTILKTRDITLPTKVHLVKALIFLIVMYGCEIWTIKKLSTEELMLLNCALEDS